VSVWFAFPLLALMAAMQTSLVPAVQVGGGRPQLLLVWVVCWAVVRGRGEAMPWAVFAGIVLDLLSQMPPGSHLLALAVVTFLADLGHRVMQGSTALFAGAAVFAASIVYGLVLVLVLFATGHQVNLTATVVVNLLPSAAYNLVLMVPVFLLQRAIDRRFPVSVLPAWR
jgi:rod shape-determining protein MreD